MATTMLGLNQQGGLNFVLTVTWTVLATTAVFFRLVSNVCTNNKIHADSVWIIIALLGLYGYTASLIWGVLMSGGALSEEEIMAFPIRARWFVESSIMTSEFFIFTNAAIKISAIALYRRLFATRRFLQLSQFTFIAVVAWWVVISIQWALICQPLTLFWSQDLIQALTPDGALPSEAASSLPGFCNSPNALLFVGDVVSILIDHVVLFMPIGPIYSLSLPLKQRLGLIALFCVGTFSCVSALVRLVFMFRPRQFYPDFADGQIWSSLHLSTAIVYACVPSYRPLSRKLMERTRGYFTKPVYGSDGSAGQPSRGVTPLMRNNSAFSGPTAPVSPVTETGRIAEWPKNGWITPHSQRTGNTSAASWVEKSRSEKGKALIIEKTTEVNFSFA